ncbi:hypothetical protein QM012_003651 [Aureobasidium pullulans]|uniref:Extracellular membrane protein CFEM domain-containing protein n=1 Tax=Aureobasidium pullulans TaxID=5580 RepID=A0ABR0T7I7_AURPU
MFSKIPIVFAILALLIQVVVSTPPACVLQAVNQAGKLPTDVKDICTGGSTVEQTLVSDCGNNFDAAMSAFSSICSGVGVNISTWSVGSSSATPVSTPVSSTDAISTSATSTTEATSSVKSDSTSTSASVPSSASSTESATESTTNAVTTATGILIATDTVTTSQPGGSSSASSPSGPTSTGAADHVEKNGWVMGAMAAAGLVIAL